MVFNATFNNISVISLQIVDKLYCIMLYRIHLAVNRFWTDLMVIGTDSMGSCKSNYHTIMTTTAPNSLNSQWYIRSKKDFDFYVCHHFVELFNIDEHKNDILLHHSVGSSFFPSYQITVANDPDSTIFYNKSKMLEPQFFLTHMIYFRRKPKQYLRLVVYVLKKIGVVQKRGKVAPLFLWLNDDDC